MPKGTAFSRICEYFRTADITEAEACLNTVSDIVISRRSATEAPKRRRRRRTVDAAPEQSNAATA